MTWSLRTLLWAMAAIVSLNLCIGTGLILGWGKWYSPSLPYRRQTEALLSGQLALSSSPTKIEHDLAWAEGGVQQVWGLGVPAWRLPFEILAKSTGQYAFPDRLALTVAILVVSYFILRALTCPRHVHRVDEWFAEIASFPLRATAAILLVLFPPIINLCSGPFNVYEEAVVYGYYYSIALFVATITFARSPTFLVYGTLTFLAGLAAFIRPTMGAYGVSTLVVCWFVASRAGWGWMKSTVGPILFGAGCGLLYYTNQLRFGSGFEFGHNLTHSSLDLNYILRFRMPFHDEPLWSAIKELIGSVFFVRVLNGFDVYSDGVVAWQSATPRWRHFYHSTFDASFLVGIAACWLWAIWSAARARKSDAKSAIPDLTVAAAWSLVAIVMLSVFYLRLIASSSRYILDFAPAINACFVGCLLGCENRLPRVNSSHRWTRAFLIALISGWWIYQLAAARHALPGTPTVTQREVASHLERRFPEFLGIPSYYSLENDPAALTGIPQNGGGWREQSGNVDIMSILFVQDPAKLRLEVAPIAGESPSEEQYQAIRAKIGLELLQLESVERTEQGRRLTFAAPTRKEYRHGIHVASLAFLAPNQFPHHRSPFRLLSVTW
jgi:hypothetical protein